MSQDINVLALVKGAERYIFLYDDASRAETLRVLGPLRLEPRAELHLVRRRGAQPEDPPGKPKTVATAAVRSAADDGRRVQPQLHRADGDGRRCIVHSHSASPMARVRRRHCPLPAVSARRAERLGADDQELSRRPGGPGCAISSDARRHVPDRRTDHARSTCAATSAGLHEAATPRPRSPGGWRRCAASSASASAKAGPRRNPAKPLRNPREAAALPHFLSTDELGRLLEAPAGQATPRACAIGRSWRRCTPPACASASWSASTTATSIWPRACVRVRGKGATRAARAARLVRRQGHCDAGSSRARTLQPASQAARRSPVFVNKFGRRLTTRSVGPDAGKVPEADRASTGAPRRTRCGTASPRTCSTAAPTSAACRSCSATRAWSPRRSTRTSARPACERPTSGASAGKVVIGYLSFGSRGRSPTVPHASTEGLPALLETLVEPRRVRRLAGDPPNRD